ncbi:tRNA-intron endonuclease catalytic domain-like protein [Phanerochaete sordida]|uniref:tRNA-splicing endonuclease subunit Sen34 n=1 Tax=Phanerochaete sordida TaxID=48140 RepID=A0A9P3GNA7_9APHY|nr:tRNA-intron endonuclease catalytic domain-like protein [Phanerochaete sordida]
MADPPSRKIQLRVSNQKAYVWDVEDLAALRADHHICGVLTGTLPHLSQQNVFLGVPLLLLPEEAVLLVSKQLAVFVDDSTAHRTPAHEELVQWNAERTAHVAAQIAGAEAKDAEQRGAANRALSEDAVRKRRAREEKRAAAARAKAIAEGADPDSVVLVVPTPQERPDTPSASANANTVYTVTVPADSAAELPWYAPEAATYATLEDAKAAGVWTYPSTSFERAKCEVFRDLWEKGHFMGGGIKFGGDFLVYPGDPLRYHSHFVATVHESPVAKIRPMEIVAHGRLGTATKKAHLLCGWDEAKQEVSYYSIEWAGFG